VLEGYLRIFTSQQQDDWDDLLPSGKFHYNNSQHSSTQQTPFIVDTRRHPHLGFEPQQPRSALESVNEFAKCMALGIEEAKVALTKVKEPLTKAKEPLTKVKEPLTKAKEPLTKAKEPLTKAKEPLTKAKDKYAMYYNRRCQPARYLH
jgi:hypothetical protein